MEYIRKKLMVLDGQAEDKGRIIMIIIFFTNGIFLRDNVRVQSRHIHFSICTKLQRIYGFNI